MNVIRKRRARGSSYEKMIKTLLVQNQQIIIQQQNMMLMVMNQFQQQSGQQAQQHQHPQQQQQQQHQHQHQSQSQQQHHNLNHQQTQHHQQRQTQNHLVEVEQNIHHNNQVFSHSGTSLAAIHETQQQIQQVNAQLQENLGHYLTPPASEQDPINEKSEEDELTAFLDGDQLLPSNLLYNPQTDIGSVTPYKSNQSHQQTPSYYSSGCESLTTPRVDQRQSSAPNISQNVVKNLADSFKSPTKPKINVQILSGSATGILKNSKAKIIQRMNISEFLRHVHPETDEGQKQQSN